MTEAPPPATMVQMLPFGFKIVSFIDEPDLASSSAIYFSSGKASRPNGGGKVSEPHSREQMYSAHWKNKLWAYQSDNAENVKFRGV